MPVSALRGDLRGRPPFARAEVHYTRELEEFVSRWSRVMTLSDVANLAGLSWDAAIRAVRFDQSEQVQHSRPHKTVLETLLPYGVARFDRCQCLTTLIFETHCRREE